MSFKTEAKMKLETRLDTKKINESMEPARFELVVSLPAVKFAEIGWSACQISS